MPRGPRNRIAKVFILQGRTGSGASREREREGKGGEAKSFAATAPLSVPSFSHLFNLTSKNDALVLHEFFCSDVGAEFHKFGCNGENFDGSYFGHLWLWPREGAQLTAAHVVPSRTEMEYKGGLSEAAVSDELIVES